jgi:hypothetical protein
MRRRQSVGHRSGPWRATPPAGDHRGEPRERRRGRRRGDLRVRDGRCGAGPQRRGTGRAWAVPAALPTLAIRRVQLAGAAPTAPAAPSAPVPRRPGRFGSGDGASGDGPRCGGSRGADGSRGSGGLGSPHGKRQRGRPSAGGRWGVGPRGRLPDVTAEAACSVRGGSACPVGVGAERVRAGAGAFAPDRGRSVGRAWRVGGVGSIPGGLGRRGSHDLDGRMVGRMQKRRMAKDRGAGALRGRPRRSTEPAAAAFFAWRCGRTPVGTTAGLSDEAP